MNRTLVWVYRSSIGDCTNNGLSARVNSSNLFWNCSRNEALEYCYENNIEPRNQFLLVERELWGEDHAYAEPLIKPNHKNQMFGGNFIYTSDSNFYKLNGHTTSAPIPVHDRFEDWE